MRYIIKNSNDSVVNVNKLTYAGNLESLKSVATNKRYYFEQADICSKVELEQVFNLHKPDAIMNLVEESHVDRSIDGPGNFIQTNIVGTDNLLDISRVYWMNLDQSKKASFRFHHISTDEIYGDLEGVDDLFTEETPYDPSSPYSVS